MRDWGVCKDCALKENCAEYKPYKRQCEDYERYKEVLTNEEWIKSCNTEQLAEWIFRVREKCYYCGARQIPDREHCAFGDEFCRNNRHEFVEWLKQSHREEQP